MAILTDLRTLITEEESRFRAAVSENLVQRISGSVNFGLNRQARTYSWNLNGRLTAFGVFSPNIDGLRYCYFDMEIVGFGYVLGNTDATVASTLTVDVHRFSGGTVDEGSIFTTKPSINETATSGEYTLYRVPDSTTLSNPTGHTLAVLDGTNSVLSEGDALGLQIDTADFGRDFSLEIYCRPR